MNHTLCDLNALTDEITTLCGHLDAAEFRLLELIRELDECAPWGLWEMKSCAHWLNWKCGIALGAAREKVRVARALPGLPRVCEAFRSGRLSYSKVRAITRIATPENDASLVEIALSATAAHIEQIVRKYRQVEYLQSADQALVMHLNRTLTYYWAEDGAMVLQGRVTPEAGAVLIRALQRADANLESAPEASREARQADALASLADCYLAAEFTSVDGGASADRFQITVHVSAATLRLDGAIDPNDPPALEDGPVLAPETVRRLACDAGIVALVEAATGEPLAIGRKTRSITPALRRALKRRDVGCRFPGCTNTRFVDAHHIEHWADGGETRIDNLVLLCRHHHRLLHEGGFTVARTHGAIAPCRPAGINRAGAELRFRDPHGVPVLSTGETRLRGNVRSLFESAAERGIEIDAQTTVPQWYGERPDYDHIAWVLRPDLPVGCAMTPIPD
jgi:hypothetical protein